MIQDKFAQQFREIQPKYSRLYARLLAREEISLPQFALLSLLATQGIISMTEASAKLLITKPAVTNLVDRLEKKGLLKRGTHVKDRRMYLLEIRPKGRQLVRRVQSQTLGVVLESLEAFNHKEKEMMTRFYALLSKKLDKVLAVSLFCLLVFNAFSEPGWAMGKRPPVITETKGTGLTLKDCYLLALKQSETVMIQKEDIETAEAQFFKAASEVLGRADYKMTFFRQEEVRSGGSDSVGGAFVDPAKRERRFAITQPVFRGFRALGALGGAGSLKQTQKEEWIRAQELLFLDVANAFYGFLEEKENLRVIEGIHTLYTERIKDLKEREGIGRSRPSEVTTANAQIKVLEAERARAAATHAFAQDLLEFLIGTPVKDHTLQDEELPKETFKEPQDYLEIVGERADVEAARHLVKTAKQNIIVAQSDFWPQVNLEHNQYNRREGLQADIDWDLLFTISIPLFHGGETIAKVKEAVSKWKKEKLNYSYIQRKAGLEVKQAYQSWVSSLEETKALKEAVEASLENFRLQKEDYTHNLVSNLDVLQALEGLHRTKLDANRAYYTMKENYWNLRVALGKDAGI